MRAPIAIGYWHDDGWPESGLPEPQSLVRPNAYAADLKEHLCQYLRVGALFAQWRGLSWCRFRCGIDSLKMGSRCLTDGLWVWPEGFVHYIEAHDVVLPDDFIQHAHRKGWKIPPDAAASLLEGDYTPNHKAWLLWARYEYRGQPRGPRK